MTIEASNKPATTTSPDGMHRLDSDESQERLRSLLAYRQQARQAQVENRGQMAIDEDFYDGIQLETEDILSLESRGQAPLVYNLTKNTVNWILGTERKSRIDFSVKPRRKSDVLEAKTKTKGVKFIQDMSHGEYIRSEAFADAVRAGLGWVEIGTREAAEPIYYGLENWRYMWFDHLGGNDVKNWRYVLREKWTDLDVAQAMFSERAEALELLSSGVNSMFPQLNDQTDIIDSASEHDTENDIDLLGGAFDSSRDRVKLSEMWYRKPAKVQVLRMRDDQTPYGTRNGVIYRPTEEEHQYLVRGKYASLVNTTKMTVRVGIFAGSTFLLDELTPYDHDDFPFFPIFCYRRKRDGMPYGVIRDIRDPQSDLNKRKSKSLFMLSAHRVIHEKGAIDNPALFRDEMDRPDGIAEVNAGALSGNKVHVVNEQALALAHIELARDDAKFIQDIAGVTDENLGKRTNATSGVAIEARQLQGHTTTGVVFDNYYHSFQLQGECILRLIEQYWDAEKEFRITGDERQDEFVAVNTVDSETGEQTNSMTRYPADFIVAKQDFRETVRIAMFDTLNELIKSLATAGMGNVAMALLDMVVDMMDELPGKDEMVARIRKINGQEGPDEGMSPQEKAQKQQEQQARALEAAKQKALQDKAIVLDLAEKEAKVDASRAAADAHRAKVDLDKTEALMKRIDMFMKAMETAGMVKLAPEIVDGADTIIAEAQAATGGQSAVPAPAPQLPVQPPAQLPAPEQQPMGGM